jgi:hypothetical protein
MPIGVSITSPQGYHIRCTAMQLTCTRHAVSADLAPDSHELSSGHATCDLGRGLQEDAGGLSSYQALLVTTGKRDPELLQYLKSVAFHQWLFEIEVTGVLHAQPLCSTIGVPVDSAG